MKRLVSLAERPGRMGCWNVLADGLRACLAPTFSVDIRADEVPAGRRVTADGLRRTARKPGSLKRWARLCRPARLFLYMFRFAMNLAVRFMVPKRLCKPSLDFGLQGRRSPRHQDAGPSELTAEQHCEDVVQLSSCDTMSVGMEGEAWLLLFSSCRIKKKLRTPLGWVAVVAKNVAKQTNLKLTCLCRLSPTRMNCPFNLTRSPSLRPTPLQAMHYSPGRFSNPTGTSVLSLLR